MGYMFLGGIVLGDENGVPYATGTPVGNPVVDPKDELGIKVTAIIGQQIAAAVSAH